MKFARALWLFLWYGILAYLGLLYVQAFLLPTWRAARGVEGVLEVGRAVIGLLLVAAVFLLFHAAARAAGPLLRSFGEAPPPASEPGSGQAFPTPITVITGAWLLAAATLCVLGLFVTISPPAGLQRLLPGLLQDTPTSLADALISMFAAGVGSSITAWLGYLKHASQLRDFDAAYFPWYVGRILMGLLLGLVFYFLFKGGMLATVPGNGNDLLRDLNDWALAGFGALVGMFSKNAIEKLRELFDTLFRSRQSSLNEVLQELPAELREQVRSSLRDKEAS